MAPAPAPATMAPLLRLTLLAALLDAAAGTCTSDEGFALGGRSINTAHAASYGACCDLCIQTAGCSYYSFETATGACELKKTAAGRAAAKGSWSGWAGTGPAPPPPSPPVAPGKWSAVHKSASCEQSSSAFVKGMGKIPLAACQAACVAEPKCGYICHADETDHACTLYGSCSEPALCGHTGWDTYQFGRPNAPAWNTTCKNGGPPRPGPSPSPTPAGPDSFDCKVRVFALEYASKIMDGADISAVQTSLGFGEGCAPPAPTAPLLGKGRRLVDTLPALAAPLTGGGATTLYIDSAKGKDSNAGTLAAPFKTLQKAQAAAVAGTTVFLRAGTFHLNTTWTLGPKASGTTWAAYENEEVIISGGVNLSGLKWTPAKSGPAGAMETSLPSSMGDAAAVPTTLFVNGVREIRAKFPNGDPLIPGGAGWSASASGALGSFEPTGVPLPNSVFVHDAAGRLLSSGASVGNKVYNFTVSPNAVPKMTGRGYDPTRADFHAYANHSAERFDTTWNNPFWNSQVSPGFSTKSLTTKHWANPASGIVHMYHSGMWGGWQYQVSSRAADPEGGDGIMFACKQLGGDGKRVTCPASDNKGADAQDLVIDGGFQECRGANIGSNKFYVENIAEELDVEREWFATGSTLRYFPATGVDLNSPKTSVIGAVLKNVIEVDGASDVTIRGLTITHTAPTFMDAYECPSGGDWSIHRGAAVFVEVRKRISFVHFYSLLKLIILPRQARDKHRESTQKRDRCLVGVVECNAGGPDVRSALRQRGDVQQRGDGQRHPEVLFQGRGRLCNLDARLDAADDWHEQEQEWAIPYAECDREQHRRCRRSLREADLGVLQGKVAGEYRQK
jgi:hypothetical protein